MACWPWQKPEGHVSVRIETATWRVICFKACEAEWLWACRLRDADSREPLGPDITQTAPHLIASLAAK